VPNKLVLIDTSAWVFALHKNPLPPIKERIDHLLRENTVAIVPMIKLELLGGTKTESEFSRLKKRLDALYLIEIREPTWEAAEKLAFNLRRQGVTAPFTDIIISSAAISADALLLHADIHFDLISEKSSLRAESLARFLPKNI